MGALILYFLVGILQVAAPPAEQENIFLGGPPPGSAPLEVSVGFNLVNITDVDEREETIDFEGAVYLRWKDPRLAHDPASVGSPDFRPGDYTQTPRRIYQGDFAVKELFEGWRPHIVIPNGIGDRQENNVSVGIWPDGTVEYTENFFAKIETPMNLRKYPFDHQTLDVFLHPFLYSRDEVVLVPDDRLARTWNQNMGIADWKREAVSMFERTTSIVYHDDSAREVSELVVRLKIERRPQHVIVSLLLPMVILVGLTWTVFWMDEEPIADRSNISFTGIVSVVAYYFVVLDGIPSVPYLTLVDVFILLTFVLIAASVVINVVVDRLNRRGKNRAGDRVDRVCRWAFPLAYGLISLALMLIF